MAVSRECKYKLDYSNWNFDKYYSVKIVKNGNLKGKDNAMKLTTLKGYRSEIQQEMSKLLKATTTLGPISDAYSQSINQMNEFKKQLDSARGKISLAISQLNEGYNNSGTSNINNVKKSLKEEHDKLVSIINKINIEIIPEMTTRKSIIDTAKEDDQGFSQKFSKANRYVCNEISKG